MPMNVLHIYMNIYMCKYLHVYTPIDQYYHTVLMNHIYSSARQVLTHRPKPSQPFQPPPPK